MTQINFLGEWRDVWEGICATCGQPLVQIVGVRTYHPAETFAKECSACLPLPTPGTFSLDVAGDQFVRVGNPTIKAALPALINAGKAEVAKKALTELRDLAVNNPAIHISGSTALWLADKLIQVELVIERRKEEDTHA